MLRGRLGDVDEADAEFVVLDRPDATGENVVRLDDLPQARHGDSRVLRLEVLKSRVATVRELDECDEQCRRLDAVLRLVLLSESLREQNLLDIHRLVAVGHVTHLAFLL